MSPDRKVVEVITLQKENHNYAYPDFAMSVAMATLLTSDLLSFFRYPKSFRDDNDFGTMSRKNYFLVHKVKRE